MKYDLEAYYFDFMGLTRVLLLINRTCERVGPRKRVTRKLTKIQHAARLVGKARSHADFEQVKKSYDNMRECTPDGHCVRDDLFQKFWKAEFKWEHAEDNSGGETSGGLKGLDDDELKGHIYETHQFLVTRISCVLRDLVDQSLPGVSGAHPIH